MASPSVLQLVADAKKAREALKQTAAQIKNLNTVNGVFTKQVGITAKGAAGLAGAFKAAAPAANVAIGAIKLLTKAVKVSVQAYFEQEEAEARLEAIVRATGTAAGLSADKMKNYAASLQQVSTYEDETIISAQAMLATFKSIKGNVFKDTIRLALDLSASFGQDLKASTLQLGKALEDPIDGLGALKRAGISFTGEQETLIASLVETGEAAEAQRVILAGLEKQIGGVAAEMADTAGGATKQLKNVWGDLMEELGRPLAEIGRSLREEFIPIIESLTRGQKKKSALPELSKDITKGIKPETLEEAREEYNLLNEALDNILLGGYTSYATGLGVGEEFLRKVIDRYENDYIPNLEAEQKKLLTLQQEEEASKKRATTIDDFYANTNLGKLENDIISLQEDLTEVNKLAEGSRLVGEQQRKIQIIIDHTQQGIAELQNQIDTFGIEESLFDQLLTQEREAVEESKELELALKRVQEELRNLHDRQAAGEDVAEAITLHEGVEANIQSSLGIEETQSPLEKGIESYKQNQEQIDELTQSIVEAESVLLDLHEQRSGLYGIDAGIFDEEIEKYETIKQLLEEELALLDLEHERLAVQNSIVQKQAEQLALQGSMAGAVALITEAQEKQGGVGLQQALQLRDQWGAIHTSRLEQIADQARLFREAGVDAVAVAKWEKQESIKAGAEQAAGVLQHVQQGFTAFQGMMGDLSTFLAQQGQAEINIIADKMSKTEEEYDEKIRLAAEAGDSTVQFELDKDAKLEELETKKREKELELKKQQFDIDKGMKIASAIMNTALAVTNAIATGGPIAGPILAGVVGALGAVQIGIIAAQQFPGLASGGIVPAQGEFGGLYRLGDKGKTETVIPFDIRDMHSGGVVIQVHIHDPQIYGSDGVESFARSIAGYVGNEIGKSNDEGRYQ